ncbi:MAG TPA: response regulator, partial [Polyangiaceae bacterium]
MTAGEKRAPAKTPLHVLVVEDNADDAELLARELGRGPYEITWERVETPEAMAEALDRKRWDIVVSDYAMPRFSAPAALALLQASGFEVPFMVVSGTIGEETAVHALKSGANDFLVKGKLARLLPAIDRELREGRGREARREAERALRTSELRFRRLAESGVVGIVVGEESGKLAFANDTFLKLVERSHEELASGCVRWSDLLAPERQEDAPHRRLPAASEPWETEYLLPSGGRV